MKSAVTSRDREMDLKPLWMSLIAGMSTCLGAVWVLCQRKPSKRNSKEPVIRPSTMSFSLALAGSVMITVSVISIIPECLREEVEGDNSYHMISLLSAKFCYRLAFHVLGYVLYFLLAKFAFPEPDEILGFTTDISHSVDSLEQEELLRTPSSDSNTSTKARNRRLDSRLTYAGDDLENHNCKDDNNKENSKNDLFRSLSRYSSGADLESSASKRAWRVAMLLFVSLSAHNFPEGVAVAASQMNSPELGLKVTIGIMVHNIPEGISIAVPCIAARPDSPWLAFCLSALSGLAEPFGAFVALFVLRKFDQKQEEGKPAPAILNMENVLAFVAGIMIMVAMAELFPEALRHTKEGKTPLVAGTVAGIVLMLATELYLAQ